MNGRRAIVGLCMACALVVSAVAAQSAGAISGTTAFTCAKVNPAFDQFGESHCKSAGLGEYKHVSIAEGTTTEVTGHHFIESISLKSTVGGIGVTLTSLGLSATGWMMNLVDEHFEGQEHYAHGEGTVEFGGVVVNKPKCFVYKDEVGAKGAKEIVVTEKITGTTTGQGMGVKFTPAAGGVLARFWILDKNKKTVAEGGECSIGATYIVSGSVVGSPNGATIEFFHEGTTAQNTLKLGPTEAGAKAGIAGPVVLEGRDPEFAEVYKPLAPTTVVT